MPEQTDTTPNLTTTNLADTTLAVPLAIPTDASKSVELTKYFTFNETGNILLATTVGASAEVDESVKKVFGEVSVFFAAMTKAITSTPNPDAKSPPANYSLYNYFALERVIDASGCFIDVTEQDVTHTTKSCGAELSKELLNGVLGLATGVGAMNFALGMMSSIGQEGLKLSASSDASKNKVGNIIFVCEYLMGMPSISAIVVYLDANKHSAQLALGPCFKANVNTFTLTMHKDTYMFVTPAFIHEYAGDLGSISSDDAYGALVKGMQASLQPPASPQPTPA